MSFVSESIEKDIKDFHSANPYYPICIELSLLIVKDLKLSHGESGLEWHAFLENSNLLFENFVLKALSTVLDYQIEKWPIGNPYASLRRDGQNLGVKHYCPDIIVDYEAQEGRAKGVFDTKNKSLDLRENKLAESIGSADIYQILFYCSRLKANLGGLIYPSNAPVRPYQLCVNDGKEINLFMLFVSMELSMVNRINLICEDVKNTLQTC